jgi:hypothetical protein
VPKLYEIKKLEWKSSCEEDWQTFLAETPWGNYCVTSWSEDSCEYGFMTDPENRADPDWEEECTSVEEGQRLCEQDYMEKLLKALSPVSLAGYPELLAAAEKMNNEILFSCLVDCEMRRDKYAQAATELKAAIERAKGEKPHA